MRQIGNFRQILKTTRLESVYVLRAKDLSLRFIQEPWALSPYDLRSRIEIANFCQFQ